MTVDVHFFKMVLMKTLHELQEDAGKTSKKMRGDNTYFADPLDRAAIEHDRGVELTIRGREMYLIQEIEQALQRIDRGEFGVCQGCGEPISLKRLVAKPTTLLCIYCKTEEETRQKFSRVSANFPRITYLDADEIVKTPMIFRGIGRLPMHAGDR